MANNKSSRLFIIAGEQSGDYYGGMLLSELKKTGVTMQILGTGGKTMVNNGLEPLYRIEQLSVFGFAEVLPKLRFLFHVMSVVQKKIIQFQPHCVVLIDYPGFNLKLAKFLAQNTSIPVLYWIPPSVWAWKENRVQSLQKYCKEVIGIFPFEKAFYQAHNTPFQYFGNPLAFSLLQRTFDKQALRKKLAIAPNAKIIAFLPGSRASGLNKNAPTMKKIAALLAKSGEPLHFVWCVPKNLATAKEFKQNQLPQPYSIQTEDSTAVLASADFAFCAGSTSTLEAALLKCPFIAMYKLNFISYILFKIWYKLPYVCLANILLKSNAFPEYYQQQMNPKNCLKIYYQYFNDKKYRTQIQQNFQKIHELFPEKQSPTEKIARHLVEHYLA